MSRSNDQKQADFVSKARQHSRQILLALDGLEALQNQFNYGGYGPEGSNPLQSGQGEDEGITPAEVAAVVFDSANAIRAMFNDNGHGANLERLI